MDKPIVVCGIDFSGTSMLAGMLHAAGVDMGDVETEEDVAATDRPIRYRTFEDKALQKELGVFAQAQFRDIPLIRDRWLDNFYDVFMSYIGVGNEQAQGKRWGVKNNGLLFLAMHERFGEIPVQWVTTYRPFEESMESCFSKLGHDSRWAAELGIEYLAWSRLVNKQVHWEFGFDAMLYETESEAKRLCRKLYGHDTHWGGVADAVDPIKKGVIPWHGSLQQVP